MRSWVDSRTRLARWRGSARNWRTAGDAIQAPGSRSARSNCAKIAASTLSFFSLAEAIALHRRGLHQVRLEPVVLQKICQPAPPERRIDRHRRPRRQPADQLQDRLLPIDDVPVQRHRLLATDHRHLGPLAMYVDTGVNRHDRASFSGLVFHPERRATGLSREGGPALIGSDESAPGPTGSLRPAAALAAAGAENSSMTSSAEMPCVFCEIIAGRAESSQAYEDEHVIAFMDIRPLTPGHMLVVPRSHADSLEALDEDLGAHLFRAGHRLARVLRRSGLPCEGVNLFLADGEAAFQEVFHVHLHVLPRTRGDGFRIQAARRRPGRGELDFAAGKVRQAMRTLLR